MIPPEKIIQSSLHSTDEVYNSLLYPIYPVTNSILIVQGYLLPCSLKIRLAGVAPFQLEIK